MKNMKRKAQGKPRACCSEDMTATSDLRENRATDHERRFSKQWSIFRVPEHIRKVDEKAYNPRVVSIGPFHRNRPELRAMEPQKLRLYKRLMKRIGDEKQEVGLQTAIKKLEGRARSCYSEEFNDISSEEFVQMMVLDGCFIVKLMRLYHKSNKHGEYVEEPIFATRWMLPNITRDLLMLENQLPFFVLKEIYELTAFSEEDHPLNKLALLFFEPLGPQKGEYTEIKLQDQGTHHHLLSLFHSSFVPSDYHPRRSRRVRWNRHENFPGKFWLQEVRILRRSGIKFKSNPGNLLNIEFENRELRIPTLFIDDSTGPLLRNLVAYEQCNAFAAPYFTCYAIFLNSIIDVPEDIEILQDAGIIVQSEAVDEEVVNLVNSITKELVFDLHDMNDCYIAKQIEDINDFCKSWKSKCIYQLSRVDFVSLGLSFLPSFK
ncbi:UPF0481 protein At3g47200-like [Syzygium oleosum]|uniref:UPF0481 protein At3g47200-like n=1 Tax=Syzygium oleosum TaxID=219896 RepID=UPI0024BB7C4B|nr:UPF0481 protein At3g47200-like [Syzygium oleosum]